MQVNMKNYELGVCGIHIEDYVVKKKKGKKLTSLAKLRVTFITN